jgi:hypothetical protein
VEDVLGLLVQEVRRRGYPLLESFLSRSPKVESLYTNPGGRALSILHAASSSPVHQQMHRLAEEVRELLRANPPTGTSAPIEKTPAPAVSGDLKRWLFQGGRRGPWARD